MAPCTQLFEMTWHCGELPIVSNWRWMHQRYLGCMDIGGSKLCGCAIDSHCAAGYAEKYSIGFLNEIMFSQRTVMSPRRNARVSARRMRNAEALWGAIWTLELRKDDHNLTFNFITCANVLNPSEYPSLEPKMSECCDVFACSTRIARKDPFVINSNPVRL